MVRVFWTNHKAISDYSPLSMVNCFNTPSKYKHDPLAVQLELKTNYVLEFWYRFDYRWKHYVKVKGNPLCACPFWSQRQCIDVLIVIGVNIAELRGLNHFMQGKILVGNSHAKLCSRFSVWLEEKCWYSAYSVFFLFSVASITFVNRQDLHSWDYLHQQEVCLTVCQ